VGSRDSLHEDKKSLPLPEVEPQPTCPACGLVNTELASYVCNCKQMINGQSGTEAKKKKIKEKKEQKETINKQENSADRKRDRTENKDTGTYLLNSFFHLPTFVVQIPEHDVHFPKSLTQESREAQCETQGATCFLASSLFLK